MKEVLNPKKAGMIAGTFAALIHAAWSILVALGVAQGLIDFITRLHFLDSVHVVQPFNFGTAIMLVLVTFFVWYIFGWIFAKVVNWYE